MEPRSRVLALERVLMATPYVGMGPCAFCGGPDAGHRVRDAMLERHDAGEAWSEIAEDYGLTVRQVRYLAEIARREES